MAGEGAKEFAADDLKQTKEDLETVGDLFVETLRKIADGEWIFSSPPVFNGAISVLRKIFVKLQIMNNRRIIMILLFLVCANAGGAPTLATENSLSVESATWRFEFDNDAFFGKDNKISSGWSLQRHSAIAECWESLQGVPGFIRSWGKVVPTLTKEGLVYRVGIAIGQVIQTPDDLSRRDLIKDDVPYAGH